jgi:hypothetical protein
MKNLGVRVSDFAEKWFTRFYVSAFPFQVSFISFFFKKRKFAENSQTVLRIFDVMLNEGSKTLYRVGLGFLKYYEGPLLSTRSVSEFVNCVLDLAANLNNCEDMLKKTFSITMRRKHIKKVSAKNNGKLVGVIEP